MIHHQITRRGMLTTALRELQDQQRRERSARTAGMLTRVTPQGVTRRPLAQAQAQTGSTQTTVVPRWG